jgi:hypothetical protein
MNVKHKLENHKTYETAQKMRRICDYGTIQKGRVRAIVRNRQVPEKPVLPSKAQGE